MMKKLILIIMLALGFWSSVPGQNIVAGEYFFNDQFADYGEGFPITVSPSGNNVSVDLNLDNRITALPDGLHRLFVRFKDSNGLWSHTMNFPVWVKHHQVIVIVAGEYFFDDEFLDYGQGFSIDVNNPGVMTMADLDLDNKIADLPDGLHRMFVRFKDSNGLWSHTMNFPVWVKHHEVIVIVKGEYFIGDMLDYDQGYPIDVTNMTSITQVFDTIEAYGNLPPGETDIFFRFKDSNGLWSHTFSKKVCTGVVTGTYSTATSSYCQGDTITFEYSSPDQPQATYHWDLDNDGEYDDLVTQGENFDFPIPDDASDPLVISYEISTSECLISGVGGTFTFGIFPAYHVTESVMVCSGESYTFPDGMVISDITSDTTHTISFPTVDGCDSTITFIITISPEYFIEDSTAVCSGDSYIFPDSTVITDITSDTTHISYLQTVDGCDSIITTIITISPEYDIDTSAIICSGGSYTFPDGTMITDIVSDTTYISYLQTVDDCDSIITTMVEVIQIDISVTEMDSVLMANETEAAYQWLDCDNGNAIIPGATEQSFTPSVSGNYAVEITKDGCVETSDCYQVIITGIVETSQGLEVTIYPNPFNDKLLISCDCNIEARYAIYDQLGRLVQTSRIALHGTVEIPTNEIENGIYFISIMDGGSHEILIQKTIVKIE